MIIEQLTHIDDVALKAFKKLIPQLTGEQERYPTREELQKVIQSKDAFILIAKENNEIIGTLTLAFYHIPSGKRAWIEDVVVDESARGKGVAASLMNHAISVVRENGIRKIDLTSRPFRKAANKLYLKLGFEIRDTNYYRLTL